jgi:tRNA dimethylallyltransferase
MIDVLELTDEASAAVYQRRAREVIGEIQARGRLPILVGGSGLYVRAVLEPLEFPGTDQQLRRDLEDELAQAGAASLHARLAQVDPAAALAIEPTNGRRIVRALEVVQLTGRPFTAVLPTNQSVYRDLRVGLRTDRVDLDSRIAARVVEMMKQGWLDEVSSLRARGLADTRTASRALGYQQLLAHLAGDLELASAIEETVNATKRFARRQESWFGRDRSITWLDTKTGLPNQVEQVRRLLSI